ncbi:hypothetical protein [Sphingopyxis panaciterrae]
MKNLLLFAAAAALASAGPAAAEPSKGTTKVAEAWLGHDAGELLAQWPVDRGFTQTENEETGEVSYTYNFGTDAYSYDETIMSGPYQAGVMMQGNVAVPIMRNDVVGSERVDVAAQQHCTITFTADANGIIQHYEYDGVKCRPYAGSWGAPKTKKK